MSYEIKGAIIKIFDKQTISEKFEKREFVIKTEEDYPQYVKLVLLNKQISLVDECSVGDDVIVNFNITGKEGKDGNNYWNNLTAWRIKKTKDVPSEPESKKSDKGKKVVKKDKQLVSESSFNNPYKEDEDMPF